jgi:hypothetical protein
VEDLTRQERNRLRKKRARAKGIVLLACMLLFFIGVFITYDVMQTVLGLKTDGSIFSFGNTGQALSELTEEFSNLTHGIDIKNIFIQVFEQVRRILEYLWRWLYELINS